MCNGPVDTGRLPLKHSGNLLQGCRISQGNMQVLQEFDRNGDGQLDGGEDSVLICTAPLWGAHCIYIHPCPLGCTLYLQTTLPVGYTQSIHPCRWDAMHAVYLWRISHCAELRGVGRLSVRGR